MPDHQKHAAEHMAVRYVANLARLELTDAEAERFQEQLDHIVAYFNELREIDVEAVQPMAHAGVIQNVFREDVVRPGLDRDQVLANAPEQASDLFRVPKIVE
ncbi:MAG: Asp-tRNA(Asn)/Glu-tRNA(Gln) amidotransferase subunit GatC [bacterium]|jgi:aspartyl-tRNA(Asn)/glutamyl-tRNA(Gln) amidotransferase subunit C